jgi:rare lipoprotein A
MRVPSPDCSDGLARDCIHASSRKMLRSRICGGLPRACGRVGSMWNPEVHQPLKGRRLIASCVLVALAGSITGCAARSRTTRPPVVSSRIVETHEGLASFYGRGFDGKRTASGARFDMHAMVAAHPTYPFGTLVRVTNLKNTRSVVVRIMDRGPARRARAAGVIIDVSHGAAEKLGFIREGRTRVRLDVLRWGQSF